MIIRKYRWVEGLDNSWIAVGAVEVNLCTIEYHGNNEWYNDIMHTTHSSLEDAKNYFDNIAKTTGIKI